MREMAFVQLLDTTASWQLTPQILVHGKRPVGVFKPRNVSIQLGIEAKTIQFWPAPKRAARKKEKEEEDDDAESNDSESDGVPSDDDANEGDAEEEGGPVEALGDEEWDPHADVPEPDGADGGVVDGSDNASDGSDNASVRDLPPDDVEPPIEMDVDGGGDVEPAIDAPEPPDDPPPMPPPPDPPPPFAMKGKKTAGAILPNGTINFYAASHRFEIVCNIHLPKGRCRMTRTCKHSDALPSQGRPLGLAAAWLENATDGKFASKDDHSNPFTAHMFDDDERMRCRVTARAYEGFALLETFERPVRVGEAIEPAMAP